MDISGLIPTVKEDDSKEIIGEKSEDREEKKESINEEKCLNSQGLLTINEDDTNVLNQDMKTEQHFNPDEDLKQEVNEQKVWPDGDPGEKDQSDTVGFVIFEDNQPSQSDVFVCFVCLRVFGSQYKLETHLYKRHDHKEPKNKQNRSPDELEPEVWPPNVQKLARRVNGKKMFFCDRCSYSVTRCDSMNKHILRMHSEGRVVTQYQCEICGKTFIDKAYLRNHSVTHTREKVHTCEVCGRAFHRQPSLKRHRQSHSDDKQYACIHCDYKTNRKHLMYKHAELHRTGRAFTCKYCGSRFYTQLSFRTHMYSHRVTSNSCSFCKVGFSSKERMTYHMRKVHFAFEIKEYKADPN